MFCLIFICVVHATTATFLKFVEKVANAFKNTYHGYSQKKGHNSSNLFKWNVWFSIWQVVVIFLLDIKFEYWLLKCTIYFGKKLKTMLRKILNPLVFQWRHKEFDYCYFWVRSCIDFCQFSFNVILQSLLQRRIGRRQCKPTKYANQRWILDLSFASY